MVSEETKLKKQTNEECIINCLPEDLIERVFFRLPRWCCALLFFPQESVSGKPYPADTILIDEAGSQSTYAVPVIGPDDFMCGSCNGLLCLYTKTSTIKIANFATGECLHLEKPVKNLREYKIIHFLGDCDEGRHRPHNNKRFNAIQVYTLGDEKWRDIRTPGALSLNRVKNSGTINVDGTMYWLAEDMVASWQHAIMSFDLNEELFALIQLPAAIPEDCPGRGPRLRLVGKLQIWTLDNKVEQRWTQKYNIQCSPDYIPGPNLVFGDKIMVQH
ncbi:hypothetical protein BRADI_4g01502v3 [Brachypodium distachyon]|uniref:F-box associated beta-propeller type 3 domain-containing protein n=1 Tax=Brachypodium distachyon TaxID=15368 RepID=A0A0Q3P9V8_BRADI|nr:hypothetical protein BRADI_4g01502v3 [Brachypodium distachyon]